MGSCRASTIPSSGFTETGATLGLARAFFLSQAKNCQKPIKATGIHTYIYIYTYIYVCVYIHVYEYCNSFTYFCGVQVGRCWR